MVNYDATLSRTAVDLAFLCGAIAFFFSFSPIKRAARESLKSMQSYTSKADELFLKVQNVEVPDYIPPYISCYETLYEQEEIITREERWIIVQEISDSNFKPLRILDFHFLPRPYSERRWYRSKKVSLCFLLNNFRA